MNAEDAVELVREIQAEGFEDTHLEVKRAQKSIPQHLYETISAFANQPEGGVIVLGLDESRQFAVVGVENVQETIAGLTDLACKMEPQMTLDIQVIEVDGKPVVTVEVPECDYRYRPCFYKPAGMQSGSFIRSGNQTRRMTPYEIFTFVIGRGQPTFDRELVKAALLSDLDEKQVRAYLDAMQRTRSNIWNRLRLGEKSLTEQLIALDVMGRDGDAVHPTLAGLLVFGMWPQKFYPSLMITFVRYFGVDFETKGPRGERFQDNAQFEGPLPEIIDQAVNRCIANMKQATLIEGVLHRMIPEYPEEAVREALVNAAVHRDYSPFVIGSQVRIEMFSDRLEVISPGGLFGPVSLNNLEASQAARNQVLIRLLGEVGLVENRGSGIRSMVSAMREAHLEPPKFEDRRDHFKVVLSNQTLLDTESLNWLNQFAGAPLNSLQRVALSYLHKHEQITNAGYCQLNSVDSATAAKDLTGLVESGLVERHGTRRWAVYSLHFEAEKPNVIFDNNLSERQRKILDFIKVHGSITVGKYIQISEPKLSRRTALRDLQELQYRGKIQQKGEKRGVFYVIPQ